MSIIRDLRVWKLSHGDVTMISLIRVSSPRLLEKADDRVEGLAGDE
jgi:hypothetical protein